MNNPWDLITALYHPNKVNPGDTIWLRGGKYGNGGSTDYESHLVGAENRPITLRAYPGERATIDGALYVMGDWTIIWGLEFTNTNTQRTTKQPGSGSVIDRLSGLNARKPNVKLINNIVHDEGGGIGSNKDSVNAEIYGNIIFNNGWVGPDRGHGHGIYSQNETGTQLIADNIAFNHFGDFNVHIYGEEGPVQGFDLEGNAFFNGKFLVGGLPPAGRITVRQNYTYHTKAMFNYDNKENEDLVIENNYLCANDNPLEVKWWHDIIVKGNTVCNETDRTVVFEYPGARGSYQWDNNTYFSFQNSKSFFFDGYKTWEQWKSETGFDKNSSFKVGVPSEAAIYVRPNQYEPKRAHIIIYNWNLEDVIPVDVSSAGLQTGDTYVLHNVQNYFEETIEGVYDGSPINIPMKGWSIALPIGWNEPIYPSTFPQFGVFVLEVRPK